MRIGSLCTGYSGLDMAVEAVYGGDLAWASDIDKGACKVLAHRYPDVPNIGDMTAVDWSTVEPVDVMCAGYPCQPFSYAGQRKGANDERHLWPAVREAIRRVRPRVTVLENVAGHRTLGFDRVLGDLAEDGLHVRWTSVRASDVGAPHRRERLFIVVAADTGGVRRGQGWGAGSGEAGSGWAHSDVAGRGLLPTPRATDGTKGGPGQRGSSGDLILPSAVALLPTPAVNDMCEGKTVEAWDEWTDAMQARHGNGNGDGKSLAVEAQRLLPTPRTENNENRQSAGYGGENGNYHGLLTGASSWGDYAAAIARWEHVLGRPAPAPTQTSGKGNPQLSPRFTEWLMGLPEGWVTDVPGITRNEALRLCGNGVVPQQAEAALRVMAAWEAAA